MNPSLGNLQGAGFEKGDLSPRPFRESLSRYAKSVGLSYTSPSDELGFDPNASFVGTTFTYDTGFSDLLGDVGYGPLGPNWNSDGTTSSNTYIPGYFEGQKPVLGHPALMTVDQFRRRYLPGLDTIIAQYGDLSQQFDYFMATAISAMEAKLGLFLYPRVVITDPIQRGFRPGIDYDLAIRELDFNATDFYNWGWMTLPYGPIMETNQLQLTYPTGAEILKFPGSWVKTQPLSRQVRLVPPQGALSELVIGPGGFLVMLIGGMMTNVPALIFADFVVGMWPFPQQIIHAIAMQTAIYFFEVFSDIVSQGMREYQVDVGSIRTMKRFSDKGSELAFAPRINRYEKQVNQTLFDFQNAYFNSSDLFVT